MGGRLVTAESNCEIFMLAFLPCWVKACSSHLHALWTLHRHAGGGNGTQLNLVDLCSPQYRVHLFSWVGFPFDLTGVDPALLQGAFHQPLKLPFSFSGTSSSGSSGATEGGRRVLRVKEAFRLYSVQGEDRGRIYPTIWLVPLPYMYIYQAISLGIFKHPPHNRMLFDQ